MNANLVSSKFQAWGTPRPFFDWLDAAFGFTVDACAEKWNAKLPRFWSPEQNGLMQDGRGEVKFCNPEYGAVEAWVEKNVHDVKRGGTAINLVASRVDADWFRACTEGAIGRQRRSFFSPARVWWLVGSEMTVGIYHHPHRLWFEYPPHRAGCAWCATNDEVRAIHQRKKKPSQALFPSSVIIMDPPVGRPRIPLRKHAPRLVVDERGVDYRSLPLLSLGRPS